MTSRRRIVLVGLTVSLAILVLYCAVQAARLHPAQARLAQLRETHRQLQDEVRQRVRSAASPIAAPSPRRPAHADPSARLRKTLQTHPELVVRYQQAERAAVIAQYRTILGALKLSDSESDQAVSLVVEAAQQRLLGNAPAAASDDSVASPLAAVLGAERMDQFQELQSILNTRITLGAFASDLYAEHPLTAAQTDALVVALEPTIPASPVLDPLAASADSLPVDWADFLARAKPILTDEQYRIFSLHATLNAEGRMN